MHQREQIDQFRECQSLAPFTRRELALLVLAVQQFLQPITDGCFLLLAEPKQPYQAGLTPDWATTGPAWAEDEEENTSNLFGIDEDEDEEFALASDECGV